MAETFSPAARAIFDKPVIAHVASIGPDGGPYVSPVWVELDGDDIVMNTALGRMKARNLASDPRVAVSLTDPDDDEVCVIVMGTVVGFTTKGADEVIDRLAAKYTGSATFLDRKEGQVRVTVTIRPDRIARQPG
jgi:PPOX class probable F420-dependent enzyme